MTAGRRVEDDFLICVEKRRVIGLGREGRKNMVIPFTRFTGVIKKEGFKLGNLQFFILGGEEGRSFGLKGVVRRSTNVIVVRSSCERDTGRWEEVRVGSRMGWIGLGWRLLFLGGLMLFVDK